MSIPFIGTTYHGGSQTKVNRIVIHCTVSPCELGGARANARYFQTHRTGSAHYVVDPGEIVQCVREGTVAYHAPPNTNTLGIELCDWQKGSSSRWNDRAHSLMLERAAALVRARARHWNVPLVKLSAGDLRAGHRGICGHADVTQAWHLTTHLDPGADFPWIRFMNMIIGDDELSFSESELRKIVREEVINAFSQDVLPAPDITNTNDPFVTDAADNPGWAASNETWMPRSFLKQTVQGLVVVSKKLDKIIQKLG